MPKKGEFARNVTLVSKSGYAELDLAAEKIGRSQRIETECKSARVRRAILFDQYSDGPDNPNAPIRPARIGMILMTDYVEAR